MKKINFVLILVSVAFLSLIITATALASFNFVPTSPQVIDLEVIPTCSIGDKFSVYESGSVVQTSNCDGVSVFSRDSAGTSTIVECDSTLAVPHCGLTFLSAELLNPGYVSATTYIWTSAPVLSLGIAILGGTAPSIGTPFDGTALKAQTATALQNTMDGVGPILAIVIGLFLTMIIIAKIIGLYKETGSKETDNMLTKHATSSERKGRGYWIFDDK